MAVPPWIQRLPAMTDLRAWLFQRYSIGALSAKDVCTCAYAVRGLDAGVADLAVHPAQEGGNFERKVNATLQADRFMEEEVFSFLVPKHDERRGRVVSYHPFILPHERLAETAGWNKASIVVGDASWARLPHFAENNTLMEHGPDDTVLLHSYVDGVPYAGTTTSSPDSIYAFYYVPIGSILQSKARRLFTVYRKSQVCRCGCAGVCTFTAIFQVLAWSTMCLMRGTWPTQGPAGEALTGSRAGKGGKPLGIHGSLALFGADLEAYTSILGFNAVTAAANPCMKCITGKPQLHDYSGEHVHAERADAAMASAIAATRIVAHCGPATAMAVQQQLWLDKRKQGGRGRAIRNQVLVLAPGRPVVILQPGDRLSVGGSVKDSHADVSQLQRYPAELHFFRRNDASFIRYWCPLFLASVLTSSGCALDAMHTVDLGVTQYVAGEIFKLIIESNVFQVPASTAEARLDNHVLAINERLRLWSRTAVAEGLCVVQRLTLGILLGARRLHRPCVSAKAAESKALFYFAHFLLQQCLGEVVAQFMPKAQSLLRASQALHEWYATILNHGFVLPARASEQLVALALEHNRALICAGVRPAPKHHMFFELSRQSRKLGNPRYYTTYPDETMNKLMKDLARSAHGSTLPQAVLRKYRVFCLAQKRDF